MRGRRDRKDELITCSTSTTSSAMAMIQTTATRKPIEQRTMRKVGLSPLSPKTVTMIPMVNPAITLASSSQPRWEKVNIHVRLVIRLGGSACLTFSLD